MEIGPISGIRASSLLTVRRTESTQAPVFEIDPSARADDETYSSSKQNPDRGLADEDSDSPEGEDLEEANQPPSAKATAGISFFA